MTHKEVGKWCQQSCKGKCVSLIWDVHVRMWCLYVFAVLVGCRRGAAADTGGGHSICIPIEPERGSVLIICQRPGALTPTSSPETQAVWADFGSATWTQGVAQKQTSCSPKMFREGRRGEGKELPGRTAHTTQPRQTKYCAAGWKKKKKAKPTYSRWVTGPARIHGGQVEKGGMQLQKTFTDNRVIYCSSHSQTRGVYTNMSKSP